MEKDMRWKTLSSEYVLEDTWGTVRRESCLKPDGKIVSPYYVYEFPDWVTAFALTKDNQVIIEKQYRHALGQTGYELPGGCVDREDASMENAIARELLEETGYRFEHFEFLGNTSANPSTNNNLMHMFLATGGERVQDQQLDENEEIEVHFFSIEEIVKMVRTGEIIQSMHVTCICLALQQMGKWQYTP